RTVTVDSHSDALFCIPTTGMQDQESPSPSYADGSERNLYKYSKYYSGAEPTFMEGDVFRIIVPLNDAYSFDFGQNGRSNQSNQSNQTGLTEEEQKLLNWIKLNPDMTNTLIAESLDWSVSKVKYYVQKLKRANKIKRAGTSRKGYWEVFEEEDN
ncbi:winged helix-turn-helix transcriptional regulator, partial [Drancourtella massiliensis]